METVTEHKKDKRKLMLIIVLLVLLSGVVIYLMTRSMSEEGRLHQSQLEQMKEKLEQLDGNLKSLKSAHKKLNHERDSIKRNVDYMWPMRSLVYNAKLRDKVGSTLDLKPGDMATMKTDSSKVIVTDIIVGGNQFTYYVHYLVRNSKGEAKEVTPFELSVIKKDV
jgi:predicted nuclease with TOPRIM domain